MNPLHNIRLQIGVGGRLFPKPMPEKFAQLDWQCPTFIVDYVRIYETISLENATKYNLEPCREGQIVEKDVVAGICAKAMKQMDQPRKEQSSVAKANWRKFSAIAL